MKIGGGGAYIYRGSQITTPPDRVARSGMESPRHGALAERGVEGKKRSLCLYQ